MGKLDARTSTDYRINFNAFLTNNAKTDRDVDPRQWLGLRKTTPTEVEDLVRKMLASSALEVTSIFTDWSNTLIHNDVFSEVQLLSDRVSLERFLMKNGASFTDTSILSNVETAFIKFAAESFKDLSEIYVVNELGYNDIWLVFPEFNRRLIEEYIVACQDFLGKHNLYNSDFHYLLLHKEQIPHGVDEPLLHIKLKGE